MSNYKKYLKIAKKFIFFRYMKENKEFCKEASKPVGYNLEFITTEFCKEASKPVGYNLEWIKEKNSKKTKIKKSTLFLIYFSIQLLLIITITIFIGLYK